MSAWEVINPKGATPLRWAGCAGRGDREGLHRLLLRRHEQAGDVHIKGSAGPGVAENMMSGTVIVEGDASQYAGATGHGGLLVIKGNASSRCGISMKGIDIVVHGNIGHMSAFMAQAGNLVVLRRCRRGAGRQPVRGAAFRARQGEKPRRRLHRERRCGPSIWNFWRTCWQRAEDNGQTGRVPPLRLGPQALHLQHRQRLLMVLRR
jgi:hypothetical protein